MLKSFACLLLCLEDTKRLGRILSRISTTFSANVIILEGELGSGKTTLCKSIVRNHLNQEIIVNSPTFTLLNLYGDSEKQIYHYDLYRLKHEDELLELGIEEAIASEALILVEWPQILKNYLKNAKGVIEVSLFLDTKEKLQAKINLTSI